MCVRLPTRFCWRYALLARALRVLQASKRVLQPDGAIPWIENS